MPSRISPREALAIDLAKILFLVLFPSRKILFISFLSRREKFHDIIRITNINGTEERDLLLTIK